MDLNRIKSNVSTMVSKGAPESDIDSYIQSEGTTVDAIRSFNPNESMATQGVLGYAQQHPFKTLFQSPVQTATGQTAQSMALQRMPFVRTGNQPLDIALNTIKDMPASAAGWAVDQMSPFNLATLGASRLPFVQKAAEAIGNTPPAQAFNRWLTMQRNIPNPVQYAQDLITGPERAAQAAAEEKFNLGQQTAESIAAAQRLGKGKIGIAQQNADRISQGYDDLTNTMKKMVSKYSDKQGLDLQKNLPTIFAQKSQQYGKDLQDTIESLPESRSSVPASNIVQGMEDALVQHGVMRYTPEGQLIPARTTLTPTEQAIFSLYKSTKGQLADNPGASIDIQDLIKNQQYLQPKFGKAWTPDDKLGASVAENISDNITDAVPEIKELRAKYAPFLEWKKAIINKAQPFNSQYDVNTNLLSKSGSSDMSPSEQRLMAKLQNVYQSPYGQRINALNQGIQQTGLNKEQAAQQAQQTVLSLRNDLAKSIRNLRQQKALSSHDIDIATQNLINKYKGMRIKAGIVGSALGVGGSLLHNILEGHIKQQMYNDLQDSLGGDNSPNS